MNLDIAKRMLDTRYSKDMPYIRAIGRNVERTVTKLVWQVEVSSDGERWEELLSFANAKDAMAAREELTKHMEGKTRGLRT